jgi:putative transcriptional regulator
MSGMRMGVLVVVMLVVASIGPSEARYIPVEAAVHSLAGQLLVATPELDDPNFSHTIVYMVQHDADGAMGLVINRVIGAGPLGKLLEGLGFEDGTDNEAEIQVHYGGPVDRGRPLVLHSSDYRRDGTLVIDDMAAFSVRLDVLRDIARGEGPRRSMVALGYAGWGASQLEREIAQGSWFTIEPDEALLFDDDFESKWERALARRGVDL